MFTRCPPSQNIGFQNRLNNLATVVYSPDNYFQTRISTILQTSFLMCTSAIIVATIPVFLCMNFIIHFATLNPIDGLIQLKNDLESGYHWGKQCALLITATVFSLVSLTACRSIAQFLENKNFALIKAIPYSADWVRKWAPKILDITANLSENEALRLLENLTEFNKKNFSPTIFSLLVYLPKPQAVQLAIAFAQLPLEEILITNVWTPKEFHKYSSILVSLTENCNDDTLSPFLANRPKLQALDYYHHLLLFKEYYHIEPFPLETPQHSQISNILAKKVQYKEGDPWNMNTSNIGSCCNYAFPERFLFGNIIAHLPESHITRFTHLFNGLSKRQAVAFGRTFAYFPTSQSTEFIIALIDNPQESFFVPFAATLAELPKEDTTKIAQRVANFLTSQFLLFAEMVIKLKEINFSKSLSIELAATLAQLPRTTIIKACVGGLLSTLKILEADSSYHTPYATWFATFLTKIQTSPISIWDMRSRLSPVDNDKFKTMCFYHHKNIKIISCTLAYFINDSADDIERALRHHYCTERSF